MSWAHKFRSRKHGYAIKRRKKNELRKRGKNIKRVDELFNQVENNE